MTSQSRRATARAMAWPVLFALACVVALAGTFGFMLWNSHRTELANAERTAQKLARALEEHVGGTFVAVDGVLRTTQARLTRALRQGEATDERIDEILRTGADALPYVRSIRMFDASGDLVHDSYGLAPRPFNVADRDYFKAHRAASDVVTQIGAPVAARGAGQWILPVSRRLDDASGNFAGAIAAGVPTDLFTRNFFQALAVGPRGLVAVMRTDGTHLMREPWRDDLAGSAVVGMPLFSTHVPNAPTGVYRRRTSTDGVDRITAYRALAGLPLVAVVAISVEDALADWNAALRQYVLIWLACALVLGLLMAVKLRLVVGRQRSEDALRDSETRLRATAANIPGFIYRRVRRPDGSVVFPFISDGIRDLLGHEPAAVMADPGLVRRMAPPEDAARLADALRHSAETMSTCVVDYRVQLPDGTMRWLRLVGQPHAESDGSITWDCVTMDVSRRRSAEEALRESEGRLQAILDTAHDAFVSVDEAGRVLAWNNRAAALFGWSAKEAIGRTLAQTIVPARLHDALARVLTRWRTLAESRQVGQRLELTAQRRDGTELPVEISISMLRAGGTLTFNAFIEDISERVEARRRLTEARAMAEHANRAKSDFLAAMSHELRTPLTSILGFSEVLQTRAASMPTAKAIDYAAHIHRAGAHLLNLINDVLDLSKAEAGHVELRPDIVALPGVIEQAVAMMRERAHDLGVRLAAAPAPADLPPVWADERKLLQVIINLLSNAVKFTPEGGSVMISANALGGDMVALRVADTGIGIEPEQIGRALTVFGQIDSSIARKHTGTGLGLPLARKIVELHGGTLELDSAVGIGTTVTVRLPAAEPARRLASVA